MSGELRQAVRVGLQKIDGAFSTYDEARGALLVIEPHGLPTVEQLAARHLARVGVPMMLCELTAGLIGAGYQITEAEVTDAVIRHPAFMGTASPLISIGRRARSPLPRKPGAPTARLLTPTQASGRWRRRQCPSSA